MINFNTIDFDNEEVDPIEETISNAFDKIIEEIQNTLEKIERNRAVSLSKDLTYNLARLSFLSNKLNSVNTLRIAYKSSPYNPMHIGNIDKNNEDEDKKIDYIAEINKIMREVISPSLSEIEEDKQERDKLDNEEYDDDYDEDETNDDDDDIVDDSSFDDDDMFDF